MSWNTNSWSSNSKPLSSGDPGLYDLGLTQNPWKTQQTQVGGGTSYESWRNHHVPLTSRPLEDQISQRGGGPYDNNKGYQPPSTQHRGNNVQNDPTNQTYLYNGANLYHQNNPSYQPQANHQHRPDMFEDDYVHAQEEYDQAACRFNFVKREMDNRNKNMAQRQHLMGSNGAQQSMHRPPLRPIRNRDWNQSNDSWNQSVVSRDYGSDTRFQQDQRAGMTCDRRNRNAFPQAEISLDRSRQDQQRFLPHPKQHTQAAAGPLSKAAEKSLRVISCTAEGIHYWINSLADSNPLIFEVFGAVNGLDYFGNKIIFLIKGKAVSLQCNFYCMDQDVPAIANGDSVRVIGRFDRKSNQFQCISVRLATSDEKAHAMKFVQAYSKSLQKFDMSKNEY